MEGVPSSNSRKQKSYLVLDVIYEYAEYSEIDSKESLHVGKAIVKTSNR